MNSLRKTITGFTKPQSLSLLCSRRNYVSEKKQKLEHDISNIKDDARKLREDNDTERLRQKEIRNRGKDDRGFEPHNEQNQSANPFTTDGGNPNPDREAELRRMLKGEPQQNK